jgi:hypothetical protein
MAEKKCPYRFHLPEKKQGCIEHGCEFFVQIRGVNPNTGEEGDRFGCAFKFAPLVGLEHSRQVRAVAVRMDGLTKAMKGQTQMFFDAMSDEAQARVTARKPVPQITGEPNAGTDSEASQA